MEWTVKKLELASQILESKTISRFVEPLIPGTMPALSIERALEGKADYKLRTEDLTPEAIGNLIRDMQGIGESPVVVLEGTDGNYFIFFKSEQEMRDLVSQAMRSNSNRGRYSDDEG